MISYILMCLTNTCDLHNGKAERHTVVPVGDLVESLFLGFCGNLNVWQPSRYQSSLINVSCPVNLKHSQDASHQLQGDQKISYIGKNVLKCTVHATACYIVSPKHTLMLEAISGVTFTSWPDSS